MVKFVWLTVTLRMKAELKYASITTGGLSVMMTGIPEKLRSFADSLTSTMEQVHISILLLNTIIYLPQVWGANTQVLS
jgi:uncharacterized membrane protein YdfJ with MMPL/SSD domain